VRDARFDAWVSALESRHLAELTFQELARALRALSSAYVERRTRLSRGAALDGAGKRAAFALFYGPLHYLTIRQIVRAIPGAARTRPTLVDLGCGTGASGAAWAAACATSPRLVGVDHHPWALGEAKRTYRDFGLSATTRLADVGKTPLANPPSSILAAFAMNELGETPRDALLNRVVDRAARGDQLLVVEPLAGAVAPWWGKWRDIVIAAGGRADEWRFRVELPGIVSKLDRATSLDHRELTARSLWLSRT
jgi:hypothetical protein